MNVWIRNFLSLPSTAFQRIQRGHLGCIYERWINPNRPVAQYLTLYLLSSLPTSRRRYFARIETGDSCCHITAQGHRIGMHSHAEPRRHADGRTGHGAPQPSGRKLKPTIPHVVADSITATADEDEGESDTSRYHEHPCLLPHAPPIPVTIHAHSEYIRFAASSS